VKPFRYYFQKRKQRAHFGLLRPPGLDSHILGLPGESWAGFWPPGASCGLLGWILASWSLMRPPGLEFRILGHPGLEFDILEAPGLDFELKISRHLVTNLIL